MTASTDRGPITHVAVVVPARDEQDLIATSIVSINRARRALGPRVSSSCVVVADSCSDATIAVAERAALDGPPITILEVRAGLVGASRRAGTRAALSRVTAPLRSVWLANTDADTIVPGDWLTAQVELADRGADAVAGIVTLGAHEGDPVLTQRFDAAYVLNPDGSHGHVHGANLGLRADVYCAAGGWSPLSTGEDHDLVARLGSARIERTIALRVQTSARRVGRAPHGFAADLAGHLAAAPRVDVA
ncbi:MAG: glycosyltransferase [Acidimicrobiales bacterium]